MASQPDSAIDATYVFDTALNDAELTDSTGAIIDLPMITIDFGGEPSTLRDDQYPVLAEIWDNEEDDIFDAP